MARRAALLALALALRVGVAVAPPPSPEDDSGVPEAVAWSHPIGDPPVSRGPPRCRGRCVDDGEAAGAPLGGMGAGTLGRTYRGDFAQWHLRPGTHTHAPAAHTFAAVRVDGLATVLSSLEAHGGWENDGDDDVDETSDANRANRASTISSRRRVLPADGSGGTYRALYPRSSYEYVPGSISARGDVALTQTQFSPVLPGRYREASLPVAVFRFTARNTEIATRSNDADKMNATKPRAREVALMFQFENPTRTKEVAPHANGKTRLAGEGSEHAAFGGGAEYASDAETKTPHKGAHMYTKRVLHEHSPGAKKTNSVSEPWHGGLAVAAAETKGARVTVTSGIFSRAAAANHWRAFELRGECVSETGVDSVKHRVDVPSNATLAYSAVCVSFLLPPGAAREVVFSVAWDFPVASFDDAAAARAEKNGADAFATAFVKRYARYHPHGGEDVPLGAAAPALAALALARASEWEDAVRAWQKPYVDSAKPRTEKKSNADDDADATLIRRPPWFVSALFNELHHLVDAGTVWGRPLGVAGLDGVADSFFVSHPSRESEYVSTASRATATAFDETTSGEDGEGGDAVDVAGNGGVWGGSLGRFGLAQNRDAPVYNSLPAYFFGSWGIAKFWPGIDLSVVADLASAVRFEDDAERDTKWAAERVAAQAGDLPEDDDKKTTPSQKDAGSVSVARKRRKVFGAAPHDLGDTRDGSLFGRGPLRDSVNAHDVSDVNAWLDLAPMLSLLVARAHVLRLEEDEDDVLFSEEAYDAPTLERPPRGGVEKKRKKPTGSRAGLPNAVLRSLFEDAYLSVSTLARTRDPDGDGALEHVADPATHGPDHAFDRWAVAAGSKSAYCGSLWLAALRACAGLAASLDETHAAVSLDAAGARAARALNDALWVDVATDTDSNTNTNTKTDSSRRETKEANAPRTPKKTRGYYKHDESVGALGNASSVSQVFGEWALATLGLAPAHPKERTRAALETVLRVNARGGATFPANAAEASSFVSETDSETETETEPVSNANLHSGERWPAFAYVVAAHAVLVTDDYISAHDASLFDSGSPEEEEEEDALLLRRAWASARNAYDATWNGGLAFRAPEATDDEGRFRGAADVKNGAVWALDRALTQKARRARDAGRERKASVEDDRRRRSADELRR